MFILISVMEIKPTLTSKALLYWCPISDVIVLIREDASSYLLISDVVKKKKDQVYQGFLHKKEKKN